MILSFPHFFPNISPFSKTCSWQRVWIYSIGDHSAKPKNHKTKNKLFYKIHYETADMTWIPGLVSLSANQGVLLHRLSRNRTFTLGYSEHGLDLGPYQNDEWQHADVLRQYLQSSLHKVISLCLCVIGPLNPLIPKL